MLNRSGITKTSYGAPTQILFNIELQASIGCIVPQSLGVIVGTRKIAKAGTPINVSLTERQTPVTDVIEDSEAHTATANAVLLHDVDVTNGNANGTALIFGFVNLNRLETDVATQCIALTDSGNVTFLKD